VRATAILHLADASGPAYDLAVLLAGLDLDRLEVIAPGRGTALDVFADFPDAELTTLEYASLTFPRGIRGSGGLARSLVRDTRLFRRHLEATQPDLVVVATGVLPAALRAARSLGIPRVVWLGELFDRRYLGGTARAAAAWSLARLTARWADGLACCSRAVAEQFSSARERGRVQVETIYPGISESYAGGDGESFSRELGLDGASPCIAVVGNISPGRGQDVMLRAMPRITSRFPDAHCVLAGTPHPFEADRRYIEQVVALRRELGLEDAVSMPGFVRDVRDLYAAADVVVNPVRMNEAFGRVAPEALVAGRPVVATRVGAIPEILTDERHALLVDPEEPDQLADAVIRICDDRALAERLVEGGRRHIRSVADPDVARSRFRDLVERVTEERPADPPHQGQS
jgi:glycosyltransferase involved in cell wall biosynthesis